ncbi:unnamed protein product [Penicillium salamii]|uniref:Zn(2)-C6 fungal-type domain-containing protein n=1 Tax=Penicillium salamii TaxID=1612424 RepID=A0A9W4NBH1_9EURO|nr:unnamed protein product [Penicillium salamii]CAG8027868.1 unnamed protein product [Penicillium salamii]CAG8036289.1 unnamed protein product [Penicillium salamii]CAG8058246.1 unnamed protein product [Penicillium salamii]CAG8086127.1 unnamed protein product [Penicillium salamii]
MVGVPRSHGCSLCVKRRVKCDERLPSCVKCEKYGQPCPGYDRDFKFVTGKPYRNRRQPNAPDDRNGAFRTATSSPESERKPANQALAQRNRPQGIVSKDSNVIQSLCVLIDDFSQPYTPSLTHVVTRWLGFLPSIYGQNRVLDATIRSFTAHHFGRVTGNTQMVSYARSAYGEALRGLRKSLQTPAESLSTHIFCAVVMLCMYELFTDTENPDSWMKHAKGLSQLVKIRGPDRYNNVFDITLLKASRGLIVMHSMFSGDECFLASEDWHATMRQQFTTDLSAELHHSIETFFAYLTYTPSLVHRLYELRHAQLTGPEALHVMSGMLSKALDMQTKLAEWYQQHSRIASPPVETLSSTGDEMFPTVLLYTDVSHATIYCGYYSYMVIIHEILKNCGYPGDHEMMVVFFRDQICKSVEFNSVGVMGPYRMGFPLRVAFEVADTATRSWIMSCLEQFSKTYAAAQPENYKSVL